jgi:predicted amidohydrolase
MNIPAAPEKTTIGDVTIQGVNTSFGRMASGSGDFDKQYQRERLVFQFLRERNQKGDLEGADVVVLPETLIGRMNQTTVKRWEKFFAPFAEKDMIYIAGGEIPTNQGRKYDNVMTSFEPNGKLQLAKQRFPVPFSMFRPFSGEGANAYLSSLGEVSIMEIHGKKLGFLVCYEQFLSWPFFSLMSQKLDVIAAPANLWWCKDTSLPGIRAAALCLWSRLFDVPVVKAANL